MGLIRKKKLDKLIENYEGLPGFWGTRKQGHFKGRLRGTLPFTFKEQGNISFKIHIFRKHWNINRKITFGEQRYILFYFQETLGHCSPLEGFNYVKQSILFFMKHYKKL